MSYNYATYVNQLTDLMATSQTNPNFVTILPGIIDYAEQRCYRELDLLSTVVRDSSATLTSNNRNFTLPTSLGKFIVVSAVNVITPVSTAPESGTRNALIPVRLDFLDTVYNSASGATVPRFFARYDENSIAVGPWPNNDYTVEVIGTIRPTPLSVSNTTTFLTDYLPDLFMAASMIFASGYQRNFGAQSDTPQMAQSWESQYQTLLASAKTEETRKKFASFGWTPLSTTAPTPER